MWTSYWVAAAAIGVAASCSPALPEPASGAKEAEGAERATSNAAIAIDESRCQRGLGRLQPFVVTWDATAQAELAAHAQQSLAVVKMTRCELELLPACRVPGEYRFRRTSGNLQSLEVSSRDELYAKLPLSVAQLSARVGQDQALEVRYFVRGLHYATAPSLYRSQLGAGCEGATHLVLNFASGAFELDFANATTRAGGAEVLGAGAGARHEGARHALYKGGHLAACARDADCDAPVRLRLLPIFAGGPPADTRAAAELAVTKPGLTETTSKRTRESIQETVRAVYPGFRACYNDLLGRGPKHESRVEAHFTIEPDGVVSQLDLVVSGNTDQSFTDCFRELLYSARFIPAAKQATVVYPFMFSPG